MNNATHGAIHSARHVTQPVGSHFLTIFETRFFNRITAATVVAVIALMISAQNNTVLAQSGSSQPQRADPRAASMAEAQKAMAPFAWLVGEWEGSATAFMENGAAFVLQQRETVTAVAFSTALMIQGRGTMNVNGASRQTWDAAGLLGYDATSKRFMFTSASGSGAMNMFAVTTQGEGFTWGYTDAAGVETKYVITKTEDGKWQEVGSASKDGGKSWTKTIELILAKKP